MREPKLIIRGLTLWRPWAWAVAAGHKPVENRTWAPPDWLLGHWVAIHAGKSFERGMDPWIATRAGLERLPFASRATGIVGVARLKGVATSVEQLPDRARPWWAGPVGWIFSTAIMLEEPIKRPGHQGLWLLRRHEVRRCRAAIIQKGIGR